MKMGKQGTSGLAIDADLRSIIERGRKAVQYAQSDADGENIARTLLGIEMIKDTNKEEA